MQLPERFIERMVQELGHDEAMALCEALATEPTTSVRLNPLKMTTSKWESRKVEWSRWGYLLDARPSFTLDADFHAGAYYVQEASSQFAGYIMSQALGGEQECEGNDGDEYLNAGIDVAFGLHVLDCGLGTDCHFGCLGLNVGEKLFHR